MRDRTLIRGRIDGRADSDAQSIFAEPRQLLWYYSSQSVV